MKFNIGQEIKCTKEFSLINPLNGTSVKVIPGDRGWIDSMGVVHYITGEARGLTQPLTNFFFEGYDTENMAKLIMDHLRSSFDMKPLFQGTGNTETEFEDEIEEILSSIIY